MISTHHGQRQRGKTTATALSTLIALAALNMPLAQAADHARWRNRPESVSPDSRARRALREVTRRLTKPHGCVFVPTGPSADGKEAISLTFRMPFTLYRLQPRRPGTSKKILHWRSAESEREVTVTFSSPTPFAKLVSAREARNHSTSYGRPSQFNLHTLAIDAFLRDVTVTITQCNREILKDYHFPDRGAVEAPSEPARTRTLSTKTLKALTELVLLTSQRRMNRDLELPLGILAYQLISHKGGELSR